MWNISRASQQQRKCHSSFDFSLVHGVFYIAMLKKYVLDLPDILSQEPKEVQEALTYKEKLVKILDREK